MIIDNQNEQNTGLKVISYYISEMINVVDPTNVGNPKVQITTPYNDGVLLENVDPTLTGLSLREGMQMVLAGTFHSGWSNPYNTKEAYFVNGTILNRLSLNGSITPVRFDLLPARRVSFVQVNDAVAYSNGVQFGVIENGLDTAPFVPNLLYKERMVAGQHLEWYNGRLYALVDNFEGVEGCALVCSDGLDVPGGIESMDRRQNVVAIFDGTASMVCRTDDGLYVGTSIETFFLLLDDAVKDGGLKSQRSIAPYGVVPFTNQPIKGELLQGDFSGNHQIWYSYRGICTGGPNGRFVNLTQDKVSVPVGDVGTAAVFEVGGQVLYKVCTKGTGFSYNPFYTDEFNPFPVDGVNV